MRKIESSAGGERGYAYNAGVAVIFGKTVLLGKRIEVYEGAPVPFGGYWSVFGGAAGKRESPYMAAQRELFEETQIDVSPGSLRFIKTFPGDNSEFAFYVCEMDYMPSPVLNFEHTECGWFDINSLETFGGKIDSKIVECIDIYRRMKNNEYTHSTEDNS